MKQSCFPCKIISCLLFLGLWFVAVWTSGEPIVEKIRVWLDDSSDCTFESILAQMTTKEGSELSRKVLRDDIARLYRTGRFRDVQSSIEPVSDGRVVVNMTITCRPADTPGKKPPPVGAVSYPTVPAYGALAEPLRTVPLWVAVHDSDIAAVKKLLAAGADPNPVDEKGNTPLTYVLLRFVSQEESLMQAVMKTPAATMPTGVLVATQCDKKVRMELEALRQRTEQLAIVLIRGKADVNRACRETELLGPLADMPAYVVACARRLCKVTEMCLERGADVKNERNAGILFGLLCQDLSHFQAKTVNGTQAQLAHFMSNQAEDNLDLVEKMIGFGANPEARTPAGVTPLMVASLCGSEKMVKLLLKKGAHVNARDNAGKTALFWVGDKFLVERILGSAGRKAVLKTFAILLKNGADANALDAEGSTPLMAAVRGGFPELCELLLENGATVDRKDNHGFTALDYATQTDPQGELVKLLARTAFPRGK